MDYMAPLPTTELSVQGLFSGLRVGFLGSKVLCLNRQTDVEASPLNNDPATPANNEN